MGIMMAIPVHPTIIVVQREILSATHRLIKEAIVARPTLVPPAGYGTTAGITG
jgi:hypothetical protein